VIEGPRSCRPTRRVAGRDDSPDGRVTGSGAARGQAAVDGQCVRGGDPPSASAGATARDLRRPRVAARGDRPLRRAVALGYRAEAGDRHPNDRRRPWVSAADGAEPRGLRVTLVASSSGLLRRSPRTGWRRCCSECAVGPSHDRGCRGVHRCRGAGSVLPAGARGHAHRADDCVARGVGDSLVSKVAYHDPADVPQ
jgi:hypothetical protein